MAAYTTADIALPPVNREMRELDRPFFKKDVRISALTVIDSRNIQVVRKKVESARDLLATTQIPSIRDDDSAPGAKCILLRPHVNASDPSTWHDPWKGLLDDGTARIRPYDLTLTYDSWSMSEILDAILPRDEGEEGESPAGFALIGHVAHLNLREQFLPYKHLIGQVLLDKNPHLKTVINKTSDVGTESVFRTFPYEVLAGVDDLNVTVNQADCQFKFNLGEVYWNTRNGTEQERILSQFKEGETLCDVTAGVGPFAVPAGKKGVWVRANDLNPACYKALSDAVDHNKVSSHVKAFNTDGAKFIKEAAKDLLQHQRTFVKRPKLKHSRKASEMEKQEAIRKMEADCVTLQEPPTFDHFVMNLPATGIEFLRAFSGIYHGQENLFLPQGSRKLPMIHVYTFQARKDIEGEEKSELQQRLSEYIGHQLGEGDDVHLQRARLVAPNKLYYCASFRLPAAVAFATPDVDESMTDLDISKS